ncbi:eukaryotic translation initiation factor 4B isoform X2 [Strongylocentrotus purpuratus]|uniref:RRM domain-containing protein n=1 Tax=Strongylocentrotus purpuratus TaxID=7668 RepID=A0A7M7RC32_STRPU|nr:eukaryotic translation initiation factor 4B isoform X2 [Strongylocentrotus purpuratus]|eukprot:XP_787362.3 PREDICTED: eukaryotic translation initiation factor 4B isoform X2 [Strongylocentrotus purpuratus]
MAASGKKKGKKKGKTLNLNEFLSTGDNSPAPGTSFVFASKSSWAEESETADGDYNAQTSWADSSSAGMPDRISLPTAPKSAQQVEIDKDKLPPNPPYTIYLGNLPFDCETDDIEKFLVAATCNVSDVRLPTEGDSARPKGFGYAEVEDMDSLYKALALNNTQLKNRRIRVDLASQAQTDGRGGDRGFDKTPGDWRRGADTNRGGGGEWNQGGQGGGQGGDRYGSSSKPSESDRDRWRDRGGTDTPDRGGGSFGNRGYDGDRGFSRDRGGGGGGGGFERNYDRGGGGGGGGYERNYDRDRGDGGFGREWNRDRGGGGGGVGSEEGSGGGGYDRRSDRGPERFDRGGGPDRGYDRGGPDRGYERGGPERGGPDRGGPDRGGYGQSRGGYDNKDEGRDDWRKSEEGAPAPARRGGDEDYAPASERGPGEPPRERKKLVLTKRTQPIEKNPAKAASASSIFGGAKPVDTATKEREIAERLEREKRQYEQQRVTQNMEKDISRKEGPEHTNARVRRDSERSEGREGRTRHSSSGSGRGGPRPVIMRRESERSNDEEVFHKDDQAPVSPTPTSPPPPKTPTSPRQEDVKLIPAPPPKENAWAKRSHSDTVASPPAGSAGSKASHGPGDRSYGGERGGGRGGGGGARTDGERNKPPGPLPKYEEPKARDWSDANKFSSLLEDDLGNTSD